MDSAGGLVTIIQKKAVDFNEAMQPLSSTGAGIAFFHACRRRSVCLPFLRKFLIR